MKAEILNSKTMNIGNLIDLERLIPSTFTSKAINYGQGEGQLNIEGDIWGFYVNENGNYNIQYEEGSISLGDFMRIILDLESHLKKMYGTSISFQVQGMLNHYQSHEKYT